MRLSKKQYNYYKNLIDDKTYFITAKKYHGRRAVLYGNYRYCYIVYYLFLDNQIIRFDYWTAWKVKEIMDNYLKHGKIEINS